MSTEEQMTGMQALRARFEQSNANSNPSPPVRKPLIKQASTEQMQSGPRPGTPNRPNSPSPSQSPRGPSSATPTSSPSGDPPRQYRTKRPGEEAQSPGPQNKAPIQKTASPVNTSNSQLNNSNSNSSNSNHVSPQSSASNLNGSSNHSSALLKESPKPVEVLAQVKKEPEEVKKEPEIKKEPEVPVADKPTITSEVPSLNPNAPTRVGSRVRSISDSTLKKLISENHELLNQEKSRMSKIIDDASKRNKQITIPENLLKKRKNIINEILSTELQYLSCLQILTAHFLSPLRERKLVSMLEISQLFSNVEIIYEYCKEIAKILEDHITANQEFSAVGEIFLSQVDNLVPAYSNYCSNHQTAGSVLERLKTKKKFAKFLSETRMIPAVQKTELEAYLLTPVQRICRYPLLLKELMGVTPEDHPDLESLTKAHSKLSHLVSVVNENSREANNLKRLKEISEALGNQSEGFKIIMPGRRFIHEGPLTKISDVERERHFILFSDMIIWVRVSGKDKYELRKGIIPLRFFCFKNIPDNETFENCWEIGRTDTDQKWILCAKERKTKSMWLQVLGEVVEKLNRVSGFFRNSVAFKINTQHSTITREQTNEQLILRDIQNKIEGLKDNLADSNRKFKREVRALVEDEERYLFLFNDRLIITKMKSPRKFTMKIDILLSDGQVVAGDIPDCGDLINRIAVVRHGNIADKAKKAFRYEIIFETDEEKQIWLREFDELRETSGGDPLSSSSNILASPNNNNTPSRTLLSSSSSGKGFTIKKKTLKRSATASDIVKVEERDEDEDDVDVSGKKKNRKWDDDSSTTNCTDCKTLFTTTNRKHHCRNCGHIFCNTCTSKKATLKQFGYKKKVRVCDKCFLTKDKLEC